MITKLLSNLNLKTATVSPVSGLLKTMFIILLYLGGVSNLHAFQSELSKSDCTLTVNAGEDYENCNIDEVILTANAHNPSVCANVISTYKIVDSSTEVGCFTADPGVIFQKGGSCEGIDYIWRANDDLFLKEYSDNTAKITGTVTDQNGRIGIVDINLSDKEQSGTTWNASCYLDGISGPETYYRSFYGTVTADGIPVAVGTRFGAHYILADGAGFDSNQYGLGAWTGGDFGECTEWFGNLVPQTIDNSLNSLNYVWSTADGNIVSNSDQQTITVNKAGTYNVTAADCAGCEAIDTVVVTELPGPVVNAGEDVSVCEGEPVELTASADDISECAGGCVYPIERIARCFDASNVSDVWLNNITNADKGFVTSSSEFKTYDDGIAKYTAIASNGIDNIEVDITFSGYTTTAPVQSPKENNCDTYNTADWVYWTNTSGTIKTEQHGTLIVSRAGPSMQMGYGADTTRNGFGASGWLTITGGDGFYTKGDVNLKLGECAAFEAVTTVDYMWATTDGNIIGDANQKTISVDKSGTYTVSVSDCESCDATDEVVVTIDDKVSIGDFVWLDENRNGLQDDGATGVNDVQVTLYTCNGDEVASTITADNSNGEAGAYNFEVCTNSGEYYVVFGDTPEGLEFTNINAVGDGSNDSDANENGRTSCFEVTDLDNPTIDGGLVEICNIEINAGEDTSICLDETIEITASLIENTADCPTVCVYPIKDQERCYGPTGDYEVYLVSTGHVDNFKFKASEQKFVRYADNTARYTATATNGKDVIKIDALYTGYTTNVPVGSPKNNACQQYDTSDWEYWTTWSGTITSENHGIFNLSVKAAAFQMGNGADVTRTGFGASGWFYVDGGDGFYSEGDVNVTVDPCVENGVLYKWSTENGNIVGNANQKTIAIDMPGTYVVEAANCIDCVATDTITVTKGVCAMGGVMKSVAPTMSNVYPVPVPSGGTLTVEFNLPKTSTTKTSNDDEVLKVVPLKSAINFVEKQEDLTMTMFDMTGRSMNIPGTFKIVNGKAVIYLELDHIPSGKYILRAQGPTWSDAKNILVN